MATYTALVSGIPEDGLNLIRDAFELTSYQGAIDITESSKSELRAQARRSSRSVTTVMMVIDSQLEPTVADTGYPASKTILYSSYDALRVALNDFLEIELPARVEPTVQTPEPAEQLEPVSNADSSAVVSALREEISSRVRIIENLQSRLLEEQKRIESEDASHADELRDRNLSLTAELEASQAATSVAEESLADAVSRALAAESEAEAARLALSELQQTKSLQDGVLRNSESSKRVVERERDSALAEKTVLSGELEALQAKADDLDGKLSAKEDELTTLRNEQKGPSAESSLALGTLQTELSTASTALARKITELRDTKVSLDRANSEVTRLDSRVGVLEGQLDQADTDLTQAQELLAEANQNLLAASFGTEVVIPSGNLEEIRDLKSNLSEYQTSPLGALVPRSGANHSPRIPSLAAGVDPLKRVKFVFAGTNQSTQDVYKRVLESLPAGKTLVLDLTVESSADYYFGARNVKSVMPWLGEGGSPSKYLSATSDSQMSLMSLGFQYVNDIHLLEVDWAKRLRDLDEYGQNVVIICGSLSSLVGRALYMAFSPLGDAEVITRGTPVNVRSLYFNLMGIDSKGNSTLRFVELAHKRAIEVVDMLSKTFKVDR